MKCYILLYTCICPNIEFLDSSELHAAMWLCDNAQARSLPPSLSTSVPITHCVWPLQPASSVHTCNKKAPSHLGMFTKWYNLPSQESTGKNQL